MPLARKWRELVEAPFHEGPGFDAADRLVDRGYRAFYGERRPRDVRKAVRCYRGAAEASHPYAWTNLALCYLNGDGVARSLRKHFECFERAARLGHDRAKMRVAGALLDGKGVHRDVRAGKALLEQLAKRGDEQACFNLAERLLEGSGVVKNTRNGLRWHRFGARRGFASCENALAGAWQQRGTPGAMREAVRWYRRAADRCLPHAEHNLSLCYEHGTGVRRSEHLGVHWLREAVETNTWCDVPDETAWVRLAERHLEGRGVPRNRRKALRLLDRAAREGSRDAKRLLKRIKRNGARMPARSSSAMKPAR